MPLSARPNPFPSPTLAASADRLRSLAANAESRNTQTAAVRRANAALDDVEVSERTLTGFADKVNKTVEDRIVRALKSSLRDAVGRADAAIKREWERVAGVLVDDVRFVFEGESGGDSAVDGKLDANYYVLLFSSRILTTIDLGVRLGEEAIANVRQTLDQIASDSDIAGELDSFVHEFIDNRFRSLANDVYVAMLNATNAAADRALETRLTRLARTLEAATTPGQSLPPRPQQGSAPAPAPRPAQSPSGPPPNMPLPTAPLASSPRTPPSHPVQAAPPALAPAPVPRPQMENSASRPSSEALPPPARPATKPRPKSLATSQTLGQSPPNARPPAPAERSPIAKSRVSTDGGPDSDTEVELAPAPTTRGGGSVSADLNRMLAGPPGKYSRPPPPEEEEAYEEEAIPPRPPARIGMVNDDADADDSNLAPSDELLPQPSHSEIHAEAHRPVPALPAREMSVDGSHAPAVTSSNPVPGHKEKEKEKDKHKDKGQKSPKGIRGMLSHLTKSRPKKAKKDSKADEDEEDAVEVEQDVLPEPLALDEVPESFPPPPTAAPPRPAPRPVAHASFEDELGDAPSRSHAKEASTSSMHSKPSHSRQASAADGPSEQYADDGESAAPAIPAKPRRQPPNAAMSALASVMRGRQTDDGTTSDADAETSSIGSRNRTSMYSDGGNSAARPASTYSDAAPEPHHQQTSPLSQTSTPTPTPPRPARPTSVAFSDPRRSTHDSDPQPQSATSPPSGSAEPPRRPPKPVPSPLSQSPTKRKSLVSGEEGSVVPQPGPAPSIPPKPAARKSVALDDVPTGPAEHHPTVPVPRPRPTSMARPPSTATSERPASQFSTSSERRQSTHATVPDSSSPTHAPDAVEEAAPPVEESPKPARRIPGVFSTNHGALGALAAAVNGRSAMNRSMSQEIVTESVDDGNDNDENAPSRAPMPPRPQQAQAPHETETNVEPPMASPPAPRRTGPPNSGSNPDLYNNGLNFKRNQASTSGDDAAIEKGAIEWLNKHLEPQNVQIDNLFSSLSNGLNLIWSLEDATGESVGKYNKRAMLPVHRLDNLSVALNFCTKKGVSTSFCSPQDIMDGDKGKILTLMNYIMKAWPLS
ncbi:hypothetical protein HDU86_006386 [Geranomyces michiganensis]|nr:hypothetical protein HDU86_006386 [Geranomyces michiganensis]